VQLRWTRGFPPEILRRAEDRFGFTFPPDYYSLLTERRPTIGHDWSDLVATAAKLNEPLEGILFDVEHNDVWISEWGLRPQSLPSRLQHITRLVGEAPKLLPILSHRFIPASPCETDNPVFSVVQADIIHYGLNLEDYFFREENGWESRAWSEQPKHIPFWSSLMDN
jgi:hypothetical protein